MEDAIAIFAAINLLVMGLSHVFRHQAWTEFFEWLSRLGRPGAFVNGFLSLVTGTLIVAFHNVWEGFGILLTAIGWSFVLKAAAVFLFPDWGLRSMARVRAHNSRLFVIPGVLMAIAGLAIGYAALGS